MKEKIIKQLLCLQEELSGLEDNFFIIGASGLHLKGIDVGVTHDIDLLVSHTDAEKLKKVWSNYREGTPVTKDDHLFVSDFTRYRFEWMEVEVMGELKVHKNGLLLPVKVYEFTEEVVNGFHIKIPTRDEFIRILTLFGREKDLRKIEILKKEES